MPAARPPSNSDDASTGLPGLRSWKSVYLVVFGSFILWVGLLTLLSRWFA